jgi:hypothetical protein
MAKLSQLKDRYETNTDLEEKGSSMVLGDGARVLVRSQQSRTVRQYAQRTIKKNRHLFADGGSPSVEQSDEMEINTVVDVLVTGWEGMEDDDGKALAFSKEKLRELVTTFPHLRRRIVAYSLDVDNYKAIEGNSAPSSRQS